MTSWQQCHPIGLAKCGIWKHKDVELKCLKALVYLLGQHYVNLKTSTGQLLPCTLNDSIPANPSHLYVCCSPSHKQSARLGKEENGKSSLAGLLKQTYHFNIKR